MLEELEELEEKTLNLIGVIANLAMLFLLGSAIVLMVSGIVAFLSLPLCK